ncbi:hypothetical protein DFQ28_005917 [Apophysomyces sp. BC1034]|nr:hypothetical protein DFQ30_005380 [Apophysomyces sp. BC1015]KAG0177488.1 hypothetical protein DFQ29_004787 [Apophysomyces sp. BC1021]KAG0187747.1 hypothetical protein DFQ28_005917 [Apophysomyces sp. BC1034]
MIKTTESLKKNDTQRSSVDELTSLLGDRKSKSKWSLNDDNRDTFYQDAIEEIRAILGFLWPLLVTYLLGKGMRLVDIRFLGKQGSQVMAAVSLANLYTTVGGLAMGFGLLTGSTCVPPVSNNTD